MIELVKTLFKHFEENRIKDVRLEFKNELLNVLNI